MTESAIEIKPLGVNDAAALRAVATQAYRDHYLDLWYDNGDWYLQTYFSLSRFEEELRDTNAFFFMIFYNGNAVGFLKLNTNKPLPGHSENALELERIYLIKKASGTGIGTAVLQYTFSVALQQHTNRVWLKVMDSSDGPIRFYKKMGFAICGTYWLSFPQMKENRRGMYIMETRVRD